MDELRELTAGQKAVVDAYLENYEKDDALSGWILKEID